ncbi:MAG: hypothetical protein U5K74_12375 [Gemmatimonadaceae bacterium]|nr:hypothetical protein [Gemmatimonadaceae bacterium]
MAVTFQVGVTGHRAERLAHADRGALHRSTEALLRHTRDEVLSACHDGPCTLQLLSSLAEGSDRLVAEVALRLGYELVCPLPLPPADFEQDFATAESRAQFQSLLARSAHVFVVSDQSAAHGGGDTSRVAAYERAGRFITDESRLLIAIWDGEDARGRGGTGQVVDEAVVLGLPVAWIPLDRPDDVIVRDVDGHLHPLAAIGDVVRAVLRSAA